MRHFNISLSLLFISGLAFGQSPDKNYIKATDYYGITAHPDSTIVSIGYFDGLGRPEQSISVKATPDFKDIVTKIEYDGFGRQALDFLPVPVSQSNGDFIDPANITGNYYMQNYTQSVWFSEKTFENSPLNRVLAQAAPGDDWAKGAGHEIGFEYKTNTNNDWVRIYWVDANGDIQNAVGDYYEAKTLYKTVTTDENGHKIYEFKDKQGRVVLKRSFVTEYPTSGRPDPNPPTGVNKQADTYYVYDIYGNLAAVIPPLAAEKTVLSQDVLNNLCYLYRYDNRNRLVEKKLPGKGKEYMVYDKQDRLVAARDANLEAEGKWLFTKYDRYGRVVYTGLLNSSADYVALQNSVNGFGDNNEARSAQSFENNGADVYYTKTVFPTNNFQVLTISYYDDYNGFKPAEISLPNKVYGRKTRNGDSSGNSNKSPKGLPTASFVSTLPVSNGWEQVYTLYDIKSRPLRSHKINHLGGYTIADSRLNFKGMPEETLTKHKRDNSGIEVIVKDEFTYDKMLRLTLHTQSLNNSSTQNLITKNDYDNLGQLITKEVGGIQNGTDRWQEVNYQYNIRGWLTGINDVGIVLYGKDVVPPEVGDDLFAFKINYNQLNDGGSQYADLLYNGNIAQTIWRSGEDNIKRGYVYTYDELNRLLDAQFYKSDNNPVTGAYTESLAYDLNGNITGLFRTTGDSNGDAVNMDELTYAYQDGNGNSNRLLNVSDGVSNQNTGGFVDGNTNPNVNDYEYDQNGNMILDRNKGITEIIYNYLNLPEKITFSNNDYIEYIYNAVGQKVSKYVSMENTNNTVKHVEYLDGFQYTGGQLNFFPHPEGYVNVTLGTTGNRIFNYVYNYTDHLGNIRLSYTKDMLSNELKIMEENHYYPFGLKHQIYTPPVSLKLQAVDEDIARPGYATETEYQYKYNGKEFQDELGLGLYDYGARLYDPAIARWVVADPLAEQNRRWSPYRYAYNNPLRFIDPDGMLERQFEDYETGEVLGEIDDGVDETVRITKSDYEQLQGRYNNDIGNGDTNLGSYNEMIDRYSIGEVGYDIAQTALAYEGSGSWSKDVKKGNFGEGTYKCNKFVQDVLSENGVAPSGKWPPLAASWAQSKVSGWESVSQANLGDVVAGAYPYTDASGHVVIVTGIDLDTGYIQTMGTVNSQNIGDNGYGNNMINNSGNHDGKTYTPIGINRYSGK